MAPDDASLKAGRGLMNPTKWPTLGKSETALWGECQGSGKKPYQVSVDPSGPAFKCTCPSRKFPCKHGLGLMLILAEKPASFKAGDPPLWVADWLVSRKDKAEKKAEAAVEKQAAPADPAAAAKRVEKRLKRMKEGGEEMERWLSDQVRNGIATFPQLSSSHFTSLSSRLVDAQVPGLANETARLESLVHSGEGWPRRVLAQLGRMQLLAEGLKNYDSIPIGLQGDLRAYLGWSFEKEEILAYQPHVQDEWSVLGQTFIEHERLWERRTWLFGSNGKAALLLDFAHGSRTFPVPLVPGIRFKAALAFYPAAFPLRALLAETPASATVVSTPFPAYPDFNTAFEEIATALAANPWLYNIPLAIEGVTPVYQNDQWLLRDSKGAIIPLASQRLDAWELLAVSGGKPLRVFGEWNGDSLHVMSFWADHFHTFSTT